jgi:hypothetical protein
MSYLFFDLNINNYSINELKSIIKLPKYYNFIIIENKITSIKKKILNLKLPENENREFISFLNHTKIILKNELEDIEKKKLKENIIILKQTQEKLKKELDVLRTKNKKIKKE